MLRSRSAWSRLERPTRRAGGGRYGLENLEKIDVRVARSVSTVDGLNVSFEDVWSRRRDFELAPGTSVTLPALDDLIATKRFRALPKDLEDIRLLEVLRSEGAKETR